MPAVTFMKLISNRANGVAGLIASLFSTADDNDR
jgi:hypothetical protein